MNEEVVKEKKTSSWMKELIEWVKTIVFAMILAFLITRVITPAFVVGPSMEPTFHDRDMVIAFRLAYWRDLPKQDDIILFQSSLADDRILIKRVIAREGDELLINGSQLFVNGEEIDESYILEENFYGNTDITVPDGSVFVMGDNRNRSLDSRNEEIGLVDQEEVIGRVVFRIFPFTQIGTI
ncbi:signal peptidase I [Tindallia magadiensis]|uniref:Signal peptidase I n=1 Tax=Tindallia magadiensis TaxID=69895 RepID=A0A1I3GEQ9_9FIRM|nr:signal peptidase I [Tindallia magadiensis]SFI21978.1 signal peptidase I [Tindallia magadiensis]